MINYKFYLNAQKLLIELLHIILNFFPKQFASDTINLVRLYHIIFLWYGNIKLNLFSIPVNVVCTTVPKPYNRLIINFI
jgi:hypothetical protein